MRRLKHSFLLMLLLLGGTAFAQWTPTGNLTVFSENGARFYLILNGERYNDIPQTNIRIEELPNPYYNCRIIFEDKSIPEISKSALMLTDANGVMQDVTYRIKKDNKGRNVLRFYSFVPAQQNMVRPANCATYRFGNPNILIGGPGFIQNNPSRRNTTNQQMRQKTREYNNQSNQRNNNSRNTRNGGCNYAMNSGDFNDAKSTVANNSFDETKLSTAKQILSSNCMNVNQIISLLGIFSFEESKLDFAKYAYEFCIDRNNYFKVSNVFTFESSKTELNAYIQGLR